MATDFQMHAGDSKILEVAVRDSLGQPVDVSSSLIRFQLGRGPGYRPPLVQKSLADGIALVAGQVHRFDVTLNPGDTQTLLGTLYYEGEVDDAGTISTVAWGYLQILPALIDPT